MPEESRRGRRRLRNSFSNIFDITGSRLMGRYDDGFWDGFPGLGKSIIMENFQRTGK